MSYYRMHRGWMENSILATDDPFTQREAWCWLIEKAAWKPRQHRIGSKVIQLDAGEYCASLRFLATAWKWSKNKVSRFLCVLCDAGMIVTKSGTGADRSETVITICNYSLYQSERDSDGTQTAQMRDSGGTDAGQMRDKTEEGKEVNKLKKDSVAKATGASAPQSDADWLWAEGVSYLCSHNVPERQARSQIGKWRKHGDSVARASVQAAMAQGTRDPIPFIEKAVAARGAGSLSDDAAHAAFIEEQRRLWSGTGLPL